MWERNGSRMVTGSDTSNKAAIFFLMVAFLIVIFVWEYQALSTPGFAARHSHPSDIWQNFQNFFWVDLARTGYTAWRGIVGLAIAFFVAYPIGALLPLFGFATKTAGLTICVLLAIPKIAVILLSLRTFGYVEVSIYSIGLWSACIMMLGHGFFDSLKLVTDRGHDGTILEAALDLGSRRMQLYYYIILPMLRKDHISSLYIVSGSVWTATTFAEAMILGNIRGLGERMSIAIQWDSTLGHFYSSALLLFILATSTWLVINVILRVLGHNKLPENP